MVAGGTEELSAADAAIFDTFMPLLRKMTLPN